jgi:hypothetical protein
MSDEKAKFNKCSEALDNKRMCQNKSARRMENPIEGKYRTRSARVNLGEEIKEGKIK